MSDTSQHKSVYFCNGYAMFYFPDHPSATSSGYPGYVYMHRLIAEMKSCRQLNKSEIVHHINHNRADNRPENLEIMSIGNHKRVHIAEILRSKGIDAELVEDRCKRCGKLLSSNPVFKHNLRYCVSCGHFVQRKVVDRPNVDELRNLYDQYPQTKIAEMYGVSDKTISKWAKSYGLK